MKPKRRSHHSPRKQVTINSANDNSQPPKELDPLIAPPGALFWLMPALSGFACLIYQILWMRQIGLLLGDTSHSAALTLAVFFGGISLGGWYWGKRCQSVSKPLRMYAWLELGIAAAGMAILLAPVIVPHIYPMLHQEDGKGFLITVFKFISTILIVFPASFLMGGTLPLLGQAVIHRRKTFGSTTARIYAVNTMGAACGAFAAAFIFVWLIGIRMTCAAAMVASIVAALISLHLSKQSSFQGDLKEDEPEAPQAKSKSLRPGMPVKEQPLIPRPLLIALAFVSGFNLLALEVVWTRILAQLHENSVYNFATVLIVVLVCFSLGAWLASRLARSKIPATQTLLWLFALGGLALAFTPLLCVQLTAGMTMLKTDYTFTPYVLRVFVTGFAVIGPACLVLGAVFPLLMKSEEGFITHAGNSIGTLSAINTVGAILGSLAAGFLLLDGIGIWHTVQLLSALYLIIAVLLPARGNTASYSGRIAAFIMLILLFTRLDPSGLKASGNDETVLEKWEGSDCTVTVVEDPRNGLSIKINSNYSLGSSQAYAPQIFQARIPLFAFPSTDSVFFLGMGTGITAGEALNRDEFAGVKKVVVSELSANVVAASKKYFTDSAEGFDLTNGLYSDPRAKILIGDGHNQLLANQERYSMINADLFVPYQRGTGNLYSREHFQIVRERLKPGGVFVQWLPLYQMSEREFGIIANTMISVFPQVSLWRGNFQPGAEIAALVGHADLSPLPASNLDAEEDKRRAVEGATYLNMQELRLPINTETILYFYGGNITQSAELFAHCPINTQDRPIIEYGTPRSLRQPSDAGHSKFLEARFSNLVDKLQSATPPDKDP